MATHQLKEWPEYFAAVVGGRKRHEVRLNDRDYCVGDILLLKEFSPIQEWYTGRSCQVAVFSVHPLDNLNPALRNWVSIDITAPAILPQEEGHHGQ